MCSTVLFQSSWACCRNLSPCFSKATNSHAIYHVS
jgi:hypothetical protein